MNNLTAYFLIPLGSTIASVVAIFIISFAYFCDFSTCEPVADVVLVGIVGLFLIINFFGSLVITRDWKKAVIGLIVYLILFVVGYFFLFTQPTPQKIQY